MMEVIFLFQKTMIDIRYSKVNHTFIALDHNDIADFEDQYLARYRKAPKFFLDTNVVVDFAKLTTAVSKKDLANIAKVISSSGASLVGAINARADQKKVLHELGIPHINQRSSETKKTDTSKPTNHIMSHGIVRSGMQVYAKSKSLLISGNVSRGSEVIADGHIIVLGTLSGKALAGALGDKSACVFAYNLRPELLSIAGVYTINDEIPESHLGGNACVYLEEQTIRYRQSTSAELFSS